MYLSHVNKNLNSLYCFFPNTEVLKFFLKTVSIFYLFLLLYYAFLIIGLINYVILSKTPEIFFLSLCKCIYSFSHSTDFAMSFPVINRRSYY